MTTATKMMEQIRKHGKQVADDSPRTVGDLVAGDFTAQGDVMFWRLGELPSGCTPYSTVSQLAPGNTKGSRHCILEADLQHCEFYVLPNANPLQGPIIKAAKPITVEHPEHGNQTLPAGNWLVTYQRAHANELRRVAD